MKRWKVILAAGLAAFLCFAGGIVFERQIGTSRMIDWTGLGHIVLRYRQVDVSGRRVVPAPAADGRTMVALVFGQSNAGNSGESLAREHAGVYEFYKGKIYVAQDPLLGAGGNGGSVWLRLAAQAIDHGYFDTVVLVPFAVGATEITRFAPGGSLHRMLLTVVDDAQSAGLRFTHLLWHQGEADAMLGTPAAVYREKFRALLDALRARGIQAPIYVARASRCGRHRPNEEIRRAQSELVEPSAGVFAGPDTDSLDFSARYDGCHFSTEGLEQAAALWLRSMVPEPRPPK